MAHQRKSRIRDIAAPCRPILAGVVLTVLSVGTAGAQSFDPSTLSATDRSFIQQMLETERSNVARELPSSRDVVTIVRTETQPTICRYFVIQATAGGQRNGVGCRVDDDGVWQIGASLNQLVATGTPPAATISAGPRVEGTIGIAPNSAASGAATVTALEVRDDPSTWEEIPVPQRRPGGAGTTVAALAPPATATASATVDPSIFIRNAPEQTAEDTEPETQAAAAPFVPPLPVRRPGGLGTTAAVAIAQSPVSTPPVSTPPVSAPLDEAEPVEAQGDADSDVDIDVDSAAADVGAQIAAVDGAAPTIAAGPPVGSGVGGPVAEATPEGAGTASVAGTTSVTGSLASLPTASGDANGAGVDAVPLTLPDELASVPLPGRRP
ncbi:MAG: hypothetical protein RLO50_21660 [Azospirillaceae bacterium]